MEIEHIRHFGSVKASQWSWELNSLMEAELNTGLHFQFGSNKQICGTGEPGDIGSLLNGSCCETPIFVARPIYTEFHREINSRFYASLQTVDVAWTGGIKAFDDSYVTLNRQFFACRHLCVVAKIQQKSFNFHALKNFAVLKIPEPELQLCHSFTSRVQMAGVG